MYLSLTRAANESSPNLRDDRRPFSPVVIQPPYRVVTPAGAHSSSTPCTHPALHGSVIIPRRRRSPTGSIRLSSVLCPCALFQPLRRWSLFPRAVFVPPPSPAVMAAFVQSAALTRTLGASTSVCGTPVVCTKRVASVAAAPVNTTIEAAKHAQFKAAKKANRRRPKKHSPADINRKPPAYNVEPLRAEGYVLSPIACCCVHIACALLGRRVASVRAGVCVFVLRGEVGVAVRYSFAACSLCFAMLRWCSDLGFVSLFLVHLAVTVGVSSCRLAFVLSMQVAGGLDSGSVNEKRSIGLLRFVCLSRLISECGNVAYGALALIR